MKHAIVNGEKHEPKKGLSGSCILCGMQMIAKCGDKKIHHWSHKGKLECDPWWENETKWHRDWKDTFPKEWQEIVHISDHGEKHVADIQTNQGCTIEFQHSYLNPNERKSRLDFYKNLVWVIDGKRLKNDEMRLAKAMSQSVKIGPVIKVNPEASSLLSDWSNDHSPVFFDFGIARNNPERSVLWLLLPKAIDGMAYIFPYSRSDFIEAHLNGDSSIAIELQKLLKDWPVLIQNFNKNRF